MNRDTFYKITSELQHVLAGSEFEGHVYAVGGSVRDLVMGNPIKDIDLVVDLEEGGIRLANWLEGQGLLGQRVVTYPTFGTAMFRLASFPEHELEAVHTRGEKYTSGSRNPETCFCGIREDAFRRDLTINALYYNIASGEIMDFTGKGLDDIRDHVIRVTNDDPDVVFTDDPLRILRVVRFASRYNWEIEKQTRLSMRRNVESLSIISQERITAEYTSMLTCENAWYAMRLLDWLLCDKYRLLFGKYDWAAWGCVWKTGEVIDDVPQDIVTRLGVVFGGAYRDVIAGVLRYMKYPNSVVDEVLAITDPDSIRDFTVAVNDTDGTVRYEAAKNQHRCGSRETYDRFLTVLWTHLIFWYGDRYTADGAIERVRELSDTLDMYGYKLPVDGDDIMGILGCGPCRIVKDAKDALLDIAFMDPSLTRDGCVRYLEENKAAFLAGTNEKYRLYGER